METNGNNVKTNMKKVVLKIMLEVGFYVILATFDYLLSFNKIAYFHPFRRGFFCQNQDLMYPYREVSVKGGHVALISLLPLIIVISITEFLRICHKFKKKLFLRKWYRIVGPLMIGLSLCILFYETAKYCVGSLRPHFFAVCRPSIDLKNCTNRYTYITDYNCTAPENDLLIDSRKSFPSGHASISWYGMTFLVIYNHLRISRRWRFLRPLFALLQTVALCVATYIGVSRIQDNAHRPVDIIAGAVIGISFAVITVSLTSALFESDSMDRQSSTAKEDKRESLILAHEP